MPNNQSINCCTLWSIVLMQEGNFNVNFNKQLNSHYNNDQTCVL